MKLDTAWDANLQFSFEISFYDHMLRVTNEHVNEAMYTVRYNDAAEKSDF